jgi:flotillin
VSCTLIQRLRFKGFADNASARGRAPKFRGDDAAARRDSEIKRAAYQAEIDRQASTSAQAGPLADAEARKQVVVQETEVAELEAQGEEKRLDTQVRKPADAAAYEKQGLAEAESIAKRAEALEKEADAVIGQQLAEKLPDIVRAASESFKHVDNLTVLNGAQGISEIIAQVIGQAGPALEMARDALARSKNGSTPPPEA